MSEQLECFLRGESNHPERPAIVPALLAEEDREPFLDGKDTEVARLRAMLQALIRTAGLSNREVERRMGFSTNSGYLSRLFHGYRELKLRQVLAILAAVGLPPANFFQAAFPDLEPNGDPARLQKALEELFPAAARSEDEC